MNVLGKSVLASALTLALVGSAQAADPLTVYGKLHVTVQSNDDGSERETVIQSNASRLGVKGALELNHGLEAFYTVEYEVDTDSADKNNFTARNQFVGLRGDFGSISVGRMDTLLKLSQGKVDLFNDLSGDIKNLFKGENRMAQVATYLSPSFSGVKLGASYIAEGDASQDDESGFSLAAMYGDKNLKKTNVYASVAYDSKVKEYDIIRATVQAKLADFKVGGMYQQQEASVDGSSATGFLVSGAYSLTKMATLKAQYQDMEDTGDSWSLGGDYKLGKATKLLGFYSQRSLDVLDEDEKYLGLGVEHKF